MIVALTVPHKTEADVTRELNSMPGVERFMRNGSTKDEVTIVAEVTDALLLDKPIVQHVLDILEPLGAKQIDRPGWLDVADESDLWKGVSLSRRVYVVTNDLNGLRHVVTGKDKNGKRVGITTSNEQANIGIKTSDAPHNLSLQQSVSINNFDLTSDPLARETISSSWTGIESVRTQAIALRQLLQPTLAAVEALINHYELAGSNNGPPLDDRIEILSALRSAHTLIGELIVSADKSDSVIQGQGMIAELVALTSRFKQQVAHDPLPYGLAIMIEAITSSFGIPGGGCIAGLVLQARKQS